MEDWDYLRSCEIASPEGFSCSALAAFDGEDLVGAAPLFQVNFRIDMALEPPLRAVASWLAKRSPRLMNPSILAIGSPQTEECPIGVNQSANSVERAGVLAALLRGLSERSDALGSSLVALKDVRDADALWANDTLTEAGFCRFASLPVAVLELPFRSENEYLATFSPRLRSELRRKLRQASNITVELRTSIDDIQETLVGLFQETRSHRRSDYGSFDDVGRNFFQEVMRNLAGRAQVMLCRDDGQLVSFNIFLVERNRVLAKFIGMRYPAVRQINLYYYNWLMMVRFCIDNGIAVLQTGQTSYGIKTRLGSKLKRSWIYFRHRGAIANQLFHMIAPFAAIDRTDPDLRELGNRVPYLPATYPAA